jgi:dihydroxyacetone kinase-like protein
MSTANTLLTDFIEAVSLTINANAEEVAELDRAIGDGDHVVNLQRGLAALDDITADLAILDWSAAFMKIGMTLMSSMGGASGSLFGTLFVSMAKAAKGKNKLDAAVFATIFSQGVESVKQRGKADVGEKTMLDTLIPVANYLQKSSMDGTTLDQLLANVANEAIAGMESTKDMVATKGRASFLGERAIGHIDAGARTSQLMICAIAGVLTDQIK